MFAFHERLRAHPPLLALWFGAHNRYRAFCARRAEMIFVCCATLAVGAAILWAIWTPAHVFGATALAEIVAHPLLAGGLAFTAAAGMAWRSRRAQERRHAQSWLMPLPLTAAQLRPFFALPLLGNLAGISLLLLLLIHIAMPADAAFSVIDIV
jgi:hypothetical protein